MESSVSLNKTSNSWWSRPHFCTLRLSLCAPKLHLDRVTCLTIRILCGPWCSPECSRESILASTLLHMQSYEVNVVRKHVHCTHCARSNASDSIFIAHMMLKSWNHTFFQCKATNSWWSRPHFCTLKLTLCAPRLHLDRVTWLTIHILCGRLMLTKV